MPLFIQARSFLRNLLSSNRVEADLNQEVHSHLEMLAEENQRAGMSRQEAQRAARIELGGIEQVKEQVREQRLGNWLHSIYSDCRFALRQLRKSPAFTIVAILTLALGIGATTAIFSFADLLLDHPVALQHLNRLVSVDETSPDGEAAPLSPANFRDLRKQTQSLQNFASYQEWTADLLGVDGAQEGNGVRIDQDFFATIGAKPLFGRLFFPDEYTSGKDHVVILSYAFWQREFAGDRGVTGKTLRLDEHSYSIVGVMPASFQFPPGATQFWIPLALDNAEGERVHGILSAVGLLKPGMSLQQSRAELSTVWSSLQQHFPEANRAWQLSVVSLRDGLVDEDSRQFAVLFLCVTGFVLLIACVNVANIQLARVASRERELSVRTAVGAGRTRLVRQLLTESVVLAVIGGAAGLLLAIWGVAVMRANLPPQVREICDVSGMQVDSRALVFTLFAATAAGLLSGTIPALRASNVNLRDSLEAGGTRVVSGSRRLRGLFVVSEVTLSVVLLIGAGLMVKGFASLASRQTFMHPDRLLTFHLNLSPSHYATPQRREIFYTRLLERLRNITGVMEASAVSGLPYSFYENDQKAVSDQSEGGRLGELPTVMQESISEDYFRALRLPLREGRFFNQSDAATAPAIGIVSESLARRFWPGMEALGRRLRLPESDSPNSWITIVGVVSDVRHEVYDRSFRSILYRPLAQVPGPSMDFAVRTSTNPSGLAASVHSIVEELDPAQPITLLQTMSDKINGQASALRFVAILMGLFGIVAILLSAVGIYGLIAHSVAERRREIGIRMALGARPGQVLGMVLRLALSLVAVGGAIGLVVGFILAQLLSSFLYGVRAWDPAIYVAVPPLLMTVGVCATLIPAVRASRVDPMVTLRYE
jgi:putative ABC transport system permease protein